MYILYMAGHPPRQKAKTDARQQLCPIPTHPCGLHRDKRSSCSGEEQSFLFSRNVGWVTLKMTYFYYLKKYFLDQSIQKTFFSILKKEAAVKNKPDLSCGRTLRNQ